MPSPRSVIRAVKRALRRFGGVRGLAAKTLLIFRRQGLRGVWTRVAQQLRAEKRPPRATLLSARRTTFEPSAEQRNAPPDGSLGVMVHVYYADLADELVRYLARIPWPFALLASTTTEADAAIVRVQFAKLTRARPVVRVVSNRGRDWAPLLVAFADEVAKLDYLCHLHTKKSLYVGNEQADWRTFLFSSLLGSEERVRAVLAQFRVDPSIGLLYPEPYPGLPYWAHTWLANRAIASDLLPRFGAKVEDWHSYFDYPAGSMFWARVAALRPLFDLRLQVDDFPPETGQTDGTLQHTLERCPVLACQAAGFSARVISSGSGHRFTGKNHENLHQYLIPKRKQILSAAESADLVSFDIFDTLLVRPFSNPDSVLALLESRLAREHGLSNYATVRKDAEDTLRASKVTGDVKFSEIAALIAERCGPADVPNRELEVEANLLRPRPEVVSALAELRRSGKRVVLTSDMYLESQHLRPILEKREIPFDALYVSSEQGLRKDRDGELFEHVLRMERVDRTGFLHVGDNERSDIQVLVDRGYRTPVHVMRPFALFETTDEGRALLDPGRPSRWEDDLILGLIANRVGFLLDEDPSQLTQGLFSQPELFGYCVLGPPVFAFLAWLIRSAERDRANTFHFLAREGHVLLEAYRRIARHPSIHRDLPKAEYLYASRRATWLASFRGMADLDVMLRSGFEGTLADFFRFRLGLADLEPFKSRLGSMPFLALAGLPWDRARVLDLLGNCVDILSDLAREERACLLKYLDGRLHRDGAALVDLGFGGTIQTAFMRLIERPLLGYYFATTTDARLIEELGGKVSGCFAEWVPNPKVSQPVIQYSLLLEAVLTAPEGQLIRFVEENGRARPLFRKPGKSQNYFARLTAIHRGIYDFVTDVVDFVGDGSLDMELDRDLVQRPIRLVAEHVWPVGALARILFVEDNFTGKGEIRVLDYY